MVMMDPMAPLTGGTISQSNKLLPPTGYETSLAAIQRKQKIAQALLDMGLKGGDRYTSILQPLGDIAEIWAGKSLQKDTDKDMGDIYKAQGAEYQKYADARQRIAQALLTNATPDANDLNLITGGSRYADPKDAIVESLMKRGDTNYEAHLKGKPEEWYDAKGNPHQVRVDETGHAAAMDGFTGPLRPGGNYTVANQQAVNTKTGLPEGFVRDPDALGTFDNNGNPTINQPLVGAKEAIAAAGRPQTNVAVDATDRSFGKVIPEATVKELEGNRTQINSFAGNLAGIQRAEDVLRKGIYAGAFGQTKLDLSRLGTALGMTGKDTRDTIARTQSYLINTARQMFPILQALRPASDTDLLVAQRMSGGDLSMSPDAMLSAIKAMVADGNALIKRHNQRVDQLMATYADRPEITRGLSTFRYGGEGMPQVQQAPSGGNDLQARARAILERRMKARGGAGSGQRPFP